MHPLLDVRPWPRVLLQYPLLVLTAALLGAAGAFAYSYAPLHNAKDWQIEYLEGRLATRTEQVQSLEEELRAAKGTDASADARKEADEELKELRAQLEEVRGRSGSLEKQVSDLEGKLAEAERSRDSWREKHASMEREIESMQAAAAAEPEPAPAAPAARSGTTTPTAPGADAAPAAPAPTPAPTLPGSAPATP